LTEKGFNLWNLGGRGWGTRVGKIASGQGRGNMSCPKNHVSACTKRKKLKEKENPRGSEKKCHGGKKGATFESNRQGPLRGVLLESRFGEGVWGKRGWVENSGKEETDKGTRGGVAAGILITRLAPKMNRKGLEEPKGQVG